MTDKHFRALMEGVPPSRMAGRRYYIFGVAFTGQTVEGQARHIAGVRGLGATRMVSQYVYKNGDAWNRALYPGKGAVWRNGRLRKYRGLDVLG